MKSKPAFTLIEILVVVMLLGVIMVPTVVALRNMRQKQALAASTETLVGVLKRAHIFARESKENKAWGIKYKDETTYVMVSGSPATSANVGEFSLESPVRFTSGSFEIWFNEGSGGTSNSFSIRVNTPSGESSEVSVSKAGVVEAR